MKIMAECYLFGFIIQTVEIKDKVAYTNQNTTEFIINTKVQLSNTISSMPNIILYTILHLLQQTGRKRR